MFGLLLACADRRTGTAGWSAVRTPRDAFTVGRAQALALNPGTSRSGITITAARFTGFSRDAAARISFLMMIPVTAGAIVFKVGGMAADGIPELSRSDGGHRHVGISGWIAVWGTLRFVRTRSFTPFVIYRVALGVVRARRAG